MTEEDTKRKLVTPAIEKAQWEEIDGSQIFMEYPITIGKIEGKNKRGKALSADYVLRYKNRNLAVVEAKKESKPYSDGVGQAKDYAKKLHIPFAYATNGKDIYFIDMKNGIEHLVDSYMTPTEMWEAFHKDIDFSDPTETEKFDWLDKFYNIPFEDRGGSWQPRYYQEIAVNKVIEAIAGKKDRMLLTLATGTGKTAIAFQIVWKLFNSKWNNYNRENRTPKVLFLADRNTLADQAFNSFSAFEEEALVRIRPDEVRKKGSVPTNGSVFFTIFQTFMCETGKLQFFKEYPKDFFDLVIIDECHRGGARDESTWRGILEYFEPAVQLGLTATPKREVNKNTYRYFKAPLYEYSLNEGIQDGFLTPFRVQQISTNYDNYEYTSDDKILEGIIDPNKTYTKAEYNRLIRLEQLEIYRVKKLLQIIKQHDKTLVFCTKQEHAAHVRDLINQHSKNTNPEYCVRVTADEGKIGDAYLETFKDNEKSIPTILTTSQKLSTGVDAPQVKNIVLLREVNNMVEFKQIIGRGTRLFDDKGYFTIIDFYENYLHFHDPEWDGPPIEKVCKTCGQNPCVCDKTCEVCGQKPCVCPKENTEEDGTEQECPVCKEYPCVCPPEPEKVMIKVQLSRFKELEIDSTVKTRFYTPDGGLISAEEFLKNLYTELPKLFSDEEQLRKIWSDPQTRKDIIAQLHERGYTQEQFEDLFRILHMEDSDLFDVLCFVAYNKQEVITRTKRAQNAFICFEKYERDKKDFIQFILEQYVKSGYEELSQEKLPQLLELKYHTITDAKKILGELPKIRKTFLDFQKCLYSEVVA